MVRTYALQDDLSEQTSNRTQGASCKSQKPILLRLRLNPSPIPKVTPKATPFSLRKTAEEKLSHHVTLLQHLLIHNALQVLDKTGDVYATEDKMPEISKNHATNPLYTAHTPNTNESSMEVVLCEEPQPKTPTNTHSQTYDANEFDQHKLVSSDWDESSDEEGDEQTQTQTQIQTQQQQTQTQSQHNSDQHTPMDMMHSFLQRLDTRSHAEQQQTEQQSRKRQRDGDVDYDEQLVKGDVKCVKDTRSASPCTGRRKSPDSVRCVESSLFQSIVCQS